MAPFAVLSTVLSPTFRVTLVVLMERGDKEVEHEFDVHVRYEFEAENMARLVAESEGYIVLRSVGVAPL